MMIRHQKMIQLQNQSESKGNRDNCLLILLMLYQRQRLRISSRGQRYSYQVMFNQFKFQRSMKNYLKKMMDLHMTLKPPVRMITQFHCPTTMPTSFTPGDFAQPEQQQPSQPSQETEDEVIPDDDATQTISIR